MQNTAQRRYNLSAGLMMAGYVLTIVGVDAFFRHHAAAPPQGAVAVTISVLPALPIVGVFALIGRYLVEEHDEYLRMLQVRQILIATAFALSTATVWGFLESFGQARHLDSYWVAIAWFGGLGIGAIVNKVIEGRAA